MEKNKYMVFTRKWRPRSFDEIIGQEQVVIPLKRAIELNRIMHAYLFSGPRGVGKTTTARVLAKALNCEKGPTVSPCNSCVMCNEITNGNSMDVIEIDGASNRGIDEIRELREGVGFGATKGRYKLYIIDEVHMLTKEAFNALLKTLEEPPKHVIFVFATTDPQKIPQTILSRCQHFRFRRMPVSIIVENLKMIAEKENIEFEEEALYAAAKAADGSLRDGQRLFDQAVTYSGNGKLTASVLSEMLGEVEIEALNRVMESVIKRDLKTGLVSIEKIFEAGNDLKHFLRNFIEMLRNMIIIKAIDGKSVDNIGEEEREYLKKTASAAGKERLLYMLQKALDTEQQLDRSGMPNIVLEAFILDIMMAENGAENPARVNYTGEEKKGTGPGKTEGEKIPATEKKEPKPAAPMIIDSIEEEDEIKVLTKDIIEKRWPDVIDRVKTKGAGEDFIQALESSGVVSYEDPNLFVVGENPFLTGVIRTNIEMLKESITAELKKELKVIIYCKEEYKKKYQAKKDVLEEEAKNHPVVKSFSGIFEFSDIKIKKIK